MTDPVPVHGWFDGEFVRNTLPVPVTDRVWSHGCGVFETVLAVGGCLPLWPLHADRFRDGAGVMGFALELPSDFAEIVRELLRRDGAASARAVVRVTAHRGAGCSITWRPVPAAGSHRLTILEDWPRLGVEPTRAIKTTSRAFYDAASRRARAEGAEDAVICGAGSVVYETTIGALLVEEARGRYLTPRPNGQFIPSVGLRALRSRLAIEEAELTAADLRSAAACWRVNAVRGPEPVSILGGPEPPDPDWLQAVWRAVLAAAGAG